ncbi:hypothetical protein PG997_004361 [Apiospora hydei]|uniref:Uncharacterized protein n=1 Tax=Apiospora hydei TaxID=1337664 RepID=A0ABR1X1W4_9PEZI
MGAGSQPSEKKAMKATVEDEIPVRQPAPKPRESQQAGQWPAQSAQQQPGESSSSGLQSAGPGFNHRVTNTPEGLRVNGINPSFGQQASIHQIPGRHNCIHPHYGPTLAFPFSYNKLPGLPNIGDPSFSNATFLQNHNLHHHNNNFGVSGLPFFTNTRYLSPFVRNPSSFIIANMAADYGTGSMPNTGQHFQPPVPDTTYGPIPHVYHPRSDNSHRVVTVGTAMPGFNHSATCACHVQMGAMPQVVHQVAGYPHNHFVPVAPGVSTAPFAVGAGMGYPSQPTIVQAGHAVQPIGGAGGPPFFAHGAAGPSGQPVLAQPAMMPGGMPAGGPGMAVPVSGQGPVFIGNGAPWRSWFYPPGALPDIMGVGKTVAETQAETLQSGHDQGALEPQDFKPADDDPSRMYFCRELDGNWILRNRYTLDNIPIRWYVTTNGVFYAVRLED